MNGGFCFSPSCRNNAASYNISMIQFALAAKTSIPNPAAISNIKIPGVSSAFASVKQIPFVQSATASQIFSHPTWDIILIFTMIAIGFFYGLSRGRHKMVSSVLNTYIALAVFHTMPIATIAAYIKIDNIFIVKTLIFFAIFLPLAFLLNRGHPRYLRSNIAWWQVFLLSFIQAGLLIHIVFSFLPPDIARNLAPLTKSVFANTNLAIWWLVVPLIFMIFLRKSGRDD